MKAIVISVSEFLVNTKGIAAQIGDEIVSISTIETESVGRYSGGHNDNVPAYAFVWDQRWLEASKEFPVIELESRPDLLALFNEVGNAHEEQFESASEFTASHGCFPR